MRVGSLALATVAVLVLVLVGCGGSKTAGGNGVATNSHLVVVKGLCQGAPTKTKFSFYVPNAYVRVRNDGKQTAKALVGVQFKTGGGDSTYSTSLAGGGPAAVTIPSGQSRKVQVFAPNSWNRYSLLASQGDSCRAKIDGTDHWKSLAMAAAW